MASGIFNVAKGKWAYLATLPAGGDALEAILIQTTGLVADSVMQDYATVAAVFAGTSVEATFTNYARFVISAGSTTVAPDNVNNWMLGSSALWVWNNAGGAVNNSISKAILAYRPTSGSSDSAKIPLAYYDFVATTTGTNLNTTQASGLMKAA